MNSERSDWHSDDDLASALERSFDVPQGDESSIIQPKNSDAGASIDDLFAALVAEDASAPTVSDAPSAVQSSTPVVDAPPAPPQAVSDLLVVDTSADADERVFESLDDFKPRTNFIPVQAPIDEVVVAEVVEVTETVVVEPASSQVTMPVQWTPHRRNFDEIVFGTAPTN